MAQARLRELAEVDPSLGETLGGDEVHLARLRERVSGMGDVNVGALAEIAELEEQDAKKGLTLVPLSLYDKNRKVKLGFAVARGKKQFDKRETIKKRDTDRDLRRMLRTTMVGAGFEPYEPEWWHYEAAGVRAGAGSVTP